MEQATTLPPDRLADVYTGLTADLAFAQTHFPVSRITVYLNNLASALHHKIYRNKAEKWTRIVTFCTREVPLAMHDARRELLISFIIFTASAWIGVVSIVGDPDFARLILGDSYVDMTLANIAKGEPTAVYNGSSELPMSLEITLNNIKVSFYCFAMALLTSFGTGYILLINGAMIGTFQTFFYQHGLLWKSTITIWLYGTLEIWVIIVSGAAGLALGNGWLFPGSYSRLESFRRGAKRGLKIIVGTVPIFMLAAFIEGFITRHTELPHALKLTLILISLSFILYYYIYLPKQKKMETLKPKIALYVKRSMGEKLNASFGFIKENWKLLLKFSAYLLLPLCLVQALSLNGMVAGRLARGYTSSDIPWEVNYYYYLCGFYSFFVTIGNVLLPSLVYAMLRTYQERKEGLANISLKELKPLLLSNVRKLILIILLGVLLLAFISYAVLYLYVFFLRCEFRPLLIAETWQFWIGWFLLFLLAIVLIVLLALWGPGCSLENISLITALKKSYLQGFATWKGIFFISLVMGIASAILIGVTTAPWSIGFVEKFFLSTTVNGIDIANSVGYNLMLYLLAVVQCFGAYLAMIFIWVGWAYQYGHASEKWGNVILVSDIDNFDKP